MIPRIERQPAPLRRLPLPRRRAQTWPDGTRGEPNPELALMYSNGYVTVEISQAALDAYVEHNGDVPLPVRDDAESGDRRVYDARNGVSAVYDAASQLREVATRSSDGLFVRINFTGTGEAVPPS